MRTLNKNWLHTDALFSTVHTDAVHNDAVHKDAMHNDVCTRMQFTRLQCTMHIDPLHQMVQLAPENCALQECINHTQPSNLFPSQNNDYSYRVTLMYLSKLKNIFLTKNPKVLSKLQNALQECINHTKPSNSFPSQNNDDILIKG